MHAPHLWQAVLSISTLNLLTNAPQYQVKLGLGFAGNKANDWIRKEARLLAMGTIHRIPSAHADLVEEYTIYLLRVDWRHHLNTTCSDDTG